MADNEMHQAPTDGKELVHVEAFEPNQVRPWQFHNRVDSGMDESSLTALANSIRRDGQQQLGLARRLPPGDPHAVEAIFGIRRLEACRRAEVPWRAEVRDASMSDAECAALMHGENEWTASVSPLENAVQWKAMLDAGIFANQTALAAAMGCHKGTVSRAVRAATVLFAEPWIERLVRPVMHRFTVRAADRLAEACADKSQCARARIRAKRLEPGELAGLALYDALFRRSDANVETLFVRRRTRTGGPTVAAKIECDEQGGWSVLVRPHEQSPAEMAELAEQVEALLADQMAQASGVRLGRRLVGLLTPEKVKDTDRSWLEGCVWAAARASGLDWDRWRCMSVAETLRSQQGGWQQAVVSAIGGRGADPSGLK